MALLALGLPIAAAAQTTTVIVPLVTGLAVVGSVREPAGDYESVRTVDRISGDGVSYSLSAERPGAKGGKPSQVRITRTVRSVDLQSARKLKVRFSPMDDETYPGTTASQLSRAGMAELRATGRTSLTFIDDGTGGLSGVTGGLIATMLGSAGSSVSADSANSLASMANALGGAGFTASGTLTLVEPGTVPVKILVNNLITALPARHIRGKLTGDEGEQNADMYVLDDAANPILLQFRVGADSMTVVRIDWPSASTATNMETALAARKPVDVYGIYFAFNSAEIRPQSDSTLDAIAAMMKRDPTWRLRVTGHTDNVGGDASNLVLSRRRSESVKAALVSRGIAASRLDTNGSGSAAPKATNATLLGRAQNRRVELTRQ